MPSTKYPSWQKLAQRCSDAGGNGLSCLSLCVLEVMQLCCLSVPTAQQRGHCHVKNINPQPLTPGSFSGLNALLNQSVNTVCSAFPPKLSMVDVRSILPLHSPLSIMSMQTDTLEIYATHCLFSVIA